MKGYPVAALATLVLEVVAVARTYSPPQARIGHLSGIPELWGGGGNSRSVSCTVALAGCESAAPMPPWT